MVIRHVESEARVDLTRRCISSPLSLRGPYYASLGMAYTAELPAMDELRAEFGEKRSCAELAKGFAIPEDRMHFHVAEGSPKDKDSGAG